MKFRNVVAGVTVAGLALLFWSHSLWTSRHGVESVVIQNVSQGKKNVMPIPANRTIEVGFIHSLYGGRQAERFSIEPDRSLKLQQVKFEVYDALLYYTGGSHETESRKDGFWLIPSEYRTDSINYIIPQRQRNFFVRIGEELHTAESLGEPADIIKIHVVNKP